jgi:hypothetical protein
MKNPLSIMCGWRGMLAVVGMVVLGLCATNLHAQASVKFQAYLQEYYSYPGYPVAATSVPGPELAIGQSQLWW